MLQRAEREFIERLMGLAKGKPEDSYLRLMFGRTTPGKYNAKETP